MYLMHWDWYQLKACPDDLIPRIPGVVAKLRGAEPPGEDD